MCWLLILLEQQINLFSKDWVKRQGCRKWIIIIKIGIQPLSSGGYSIREREPPVFMKEKYNLFSKKEMQRIFNELKVR